MEYERVGQSAAEAARMRICTSINVQEAVRQNRKEGNCKEPARFEENRWVADVTMIYKTSQRKAQQTFVSRRSRDTFCQLLSDLPGPEKLESIQRHFQRWTFSKSGFGSCRQRSHAT